MPIIPFSLVELDDAALLVQAIERRPAVRRRVHGRNLVRVVRHQLPQHAQEVPVRHLFEVGDPSGERQDAVAAQEANRLAVGLGVRALPDLQKRRLVGVLDAEEEALDARAAVEMQDVRIAHDVAGARGADDDHGHVFRDHRLAERPPGGAARGRILVRQVDQLDTESTVQPRDLGCKAHGIAMAPASPEAALPAVVAEVRAAARELHDYRSLAAIVAVAPGIDQLPGDAERVEVGDHRRGRRGDGLSAAAKCDAVDLREVLAATQRLNNFQRGQLAFAAHDYVDLRLRFEDLPVVIRGEDAAVNDDDVGQQRADAARQIHGDRMRRRGARVSNQEHVRTVRSDARDDRVVWKRAELRVEQGYVVTGVHERATDRQQAERRQLLAWDAAANGDMRRIEQKDAHAVRMRIAYGARTPESVFARAKSWHDMGCLTTRRASSDR